MINFHRTRLVFALLGGFAAGGLAQADTEWSPAPPINPGTQSFQVGAQTWPEDPEEYQTITLYKNGAYLASESNYGWVALNAITTTAGVHTEIAADGNGYISVIVNPDTQAPSVPSGLQASNQSSNSFVLQWYGSIDNGTVTGYEVKRDNTSLGFDSPLTRTISGLQPGIAYQFYVRAKDNVDNWSNWSSALSVTLPDTTAPTAPTSVSSSAHTAASVSLSWSAGTDNIAVTTYEVYRTTNGITTLVATTGSGTLTFVDTFVRASTSYTYVVRSRDAAGNFSPASSSAAVTTSAAPDQDGDGIPDELEVTLGIQGISTPPQATSLNVKVHRPQ